MRLQALTDALGLQIRHFNRMSSSIALLEALSINVNPYLSRNKQCAARRVHHQKVLSQESDFRCAGRATRSFTAVSLNRWFATSPVDALFDLIVECGLRRQIPVWLDFDTLAHPRITLIPYGQNINPSQFPDQNHPVDGHRGSTQRRQPQRFCRIKQFTRKSLITGQC